MNKTTQALTLMDFAIPVPAMKEQIDFIKDFMKSVLIKGEHYGEIPGCGKKLNLLKSGAEKLLFAFNLRPEFDITVTNEPVSRHRDIRVQCRIVNKSTGLEVAQGVGEASTLETKWNSRSTVSEVTAFNVPPNYWDDRKIEILQTVDPSLKNQSLGIMKNDDGIWVITIKGASTEDRNPADNYNTILKMAKKRAMVDGTITATACSDIFTQDNEDMNNNQPETKTPQKATTTSAKKTPASNGASGPKLSKGQGGLLLNKFRNCGFNESDVEKYLIHHFEVKIVWDLPASAVTSIMALVEDNSLSPLVES